MTSQVYLLSGIIASVHASACYFASWSPVMTLQLAQLYGLRAVSAHLLRTSGVLGIIMALLNFSSVSERTGDT